MKAVFFTFFALIFAMSSSETTDYKAHNEGFLVDLDEAYLESKNTGKPIMALFTGSDWCGWCTRLTNDVFSKPEFKQWADENVILLEVDFPRKKVLPEKIKAQNANLQQSFQIRGYPTVWLFNMDKDSTGNHVTLDALGKTGYDSSVEEFIKICNGFLGK